jgi:septum formation protein
MIWNYTDKAELTMKNFSEEDLKIIYLKYQMKPYMLIMFIKLKVREEIYFQISTGDEDTIMGLPVKKIKEYLKIINEKIFSYRKSN